MSGRPTTEDNEGWQRFLRLEREQIAERATGKLARAIGLTLPGEDWEELNRIAREDERRARQGLVELRRGEKVWHTHIDKLTRKDRPARLEAEKVWLDWLRSRVERRLEEQGRYPS
jgi:hypothetical protein